VWQRAARFQAIAPRQTEDCVQGACHDPQFNEIKQLKRRGCAALSSAGDIRQGLKLNSMNRR
jgi:hypothetical protein